MRKAKRIAKALENAGIAVEEIDEHDGPGVTAIWVFLPSASFIISVYDRALRRKRVPLVRIKMNDLGMVTIHDMLVPEPEVAAEVKMLIEREQKLQRLQRQVKQLQKKLKAA